MKVSKEKKSIELEHKDFKFIEGYGFGVTINTPYYQLIINEGFIKVTSNDSILQLKEFNKDYSMISVLIEDK